MSGSGEPGDRPGDVRSEPHFYRASEAKPAVLIGDEPGYAGPGERIEMGPPDSRGFHHPTVVRVEDDPTVDHTPVTQET